MQKKFGHYAFIIGVVLAVILGLAGTALGSETNAWLTSLLVILGLIVGLLNVTGKETKEFLIVATVLVIAAGLGSAGSSLGGVMFLGPYLSGLFNSIMAFAVPAVVIVGLKDLYRLGKAN